MRTKFFLIPAICCVLLFCKVQAQHDLNIATVTGQPVTVALTTQPVNQVKCKGSSVTFTVAANGTSPINYQWKKGGATISNATSTSYTISNLTTADEGIYTCEASNLCKSITSSNAELKVVELSANAGTDVSICNGQNTVLNATGSSNHATESGAFNYSWSPSTGLTVTNIYNPTANPIVNTDYSVTVTDQLGCNKTDQVTVIVGNVYQDQELCLVTVDPAIGKNKIIWQKTQGVGTAAYNIYKEVYTNVFNWIGNVPADSVAVFIDMSSNPMATSAKYKITAIDTCGAESNKSYYHKTINLTLGASGSTMGLNWQMYLDESNSFIPMQYLIYRGTSTDNLTLLDSVPGSNTNYNDVNVYNLYYYMVGVVRQGGCDPTMKTNYSTAFSNQKENSSFVGINKVQNSENTLSIFPNPFNESTTVKLSNSEKKSYTVSIVDLTGKVIRIYKNISAEKFVIEKADLKAGIYFIEASGEKTFRGKLIIE